MKKWIYSSGLIRLKGVQTYFAARLSNLAAQLASCWIHVESFPEVTDEKMKIFSKTMTRIAEEADAISLPMTATQARRLISCLVELQTGNDFQAAYDELQNRFDDEIKGVKFLFIKPDKIGWFESTETAGEQFKANFPKANSELIEAGNCFALDRYTACVFHLTRVLEIVLSSLHHALGIVEPANEHDKTWGRTLGRIQEKIKENDKTNPIGWAADVEFYKKVHALLAAMKTPFRDSTVHVVATYDEAGASALLWAAVGALGHVATKLKEKP